MQVLILGAGMIGSVYAGRLLAAGHEVVFLSRGRRLADLQTDGLILEQAQSGQRTTVPIMAVATLGRGDRFDLVLVLVRAEQLIGTLPVLSGMRDVGAQVLGRKHPPGGRPLKHDGKTGLRVPMGLPVGRGSR